MFFLNFLWSHKRFYIQFLTLSQFLTNFNLKASPGKNTSKEYCALKHNATAIRVNTYDFLDAAWNLMYSHNTQNIKLGFQAVYKCHTTINSCYPTDYECHKTINSCYPTDYECHKTINSWYPTDYECHKTINSCYPTDYECNKTIHLSPDLRCYSW